MIARAKSADGTDTLGEGADHEINLVLEPRFVGETAAIRSQHAEGMRLVHQKLEAVFLLDLDEIGERRAVAQHRVDAFQHHEPAAAVFLAARKALVEIGRVIVAEPHQLGARQGAAVIDGRMRIGVQIDRVARTREARHHAEVRLVAGGEDDAVLAVEKAREFRFEILVQA